MIKKELNEFFKYCKKEKILCFCSVICLFVIFGSRLFTQNISVDTEVLILDPTSNYNWLDIGRYGLVFIKDILGLYSYNPYYSAGIFFILSIISTLFWLYLIDKYTNNKNKLLQLLSIFIIFANTIYAEQFYFTLQRVGIMAGILLVLISSHLSFQYTINNKKIYALVSIFLNTIVFSIYQSFIALYLSLIIGIYILQNNHTTYNNSKIEFEKLKKIIIELGSIFLISYFIFSILSKIFINSEYLTSSIRWTKQSFGSIVVHIILIIGYILVINNKFYDWSLLIIGLLMFVTQIKVVKGKNIVNKFRCIISSILLLLTPFLIIIYSGSYQAVRTYINLPFVVSLCFFIVNDNINLIFNGERIKKTLCCILTFVFVFFSFKQYHMSSRLYYADDIVNNYDKELSLSIYEDALSKVNNDKYHLIIIGNTNYVFPSSAQVGDMIGKSIFNVHSDVEPLYYWSNIRIQKNININGFNGFDYPSKEMVSFALQYLKDNPDIPVYPNLDSIVIVDDLIIVKLSDEF